MKQLSTFILSSILLTAALVSTTAAQLHAQTTPDTTNTPTLKRVPMPADSLKMNVDAVYNRPFLQAGKLPIAIGGYVEGNTSYFVTDGVTDGLSFQLQRMTLFVSSTITRRIKFLSEIELEEGGRELNIEFASMDMEFHPLLNLRGGIVMNPIGAFNQNHDGPKWEFISRPISATTIIPSTWSNAGFGLFGKYAHRQWVFAYEVYATNGFDGSIIANGQGRTWLPATKANTERFTESANGAPLATLKTAIRHRKVGELGISWMGGIYNKYEDDGLVVDARRRVDVVAVDFNTTMKRTNTFINGEWVQAFIQVPHTYSPQFGSKQQGGFVDIVQPLVRRKMLGWKNSTLNVALRLEYADYNVGQFRASGTNIGDDIAAVVPAVSFRPSNQTVLRLNYRYEWATDLLGNEPTRTGGLQVGFSTYF